MNILYHFAIMMNKDTCCDDSVVTCSDIVVYTVYNVYVSFSLVKLVKVFFSLFSLICYRFYHSGE